MATEIIVPTLGESVNRYRRKIMRMMKRAFLPQVHELYRVNMSRA